MMFIFSGFLALEWDLFKKMTLKRIKMDIDNCRLYSGAGYCAFLAGERRTHAAPHR